MTIGTDRSETGMVGRSIINAEGIHHSRSEGGPHKHGIKKSAVKESIGDEMYMEGWIHVSGRAV